MPKDTTSDAKNRGSAVDTTEDTLLTAMEESQGRSRVSQVLNALAGDDFKKITEAIRGPSDKKFTQVLNRVTNNTQSIRAAEARVKAREHELKDINKDLNRLRQQGQRLDAQIEKMKSKITVRTSKDAARLSGKDLLD